MNINEKYNEERCEPGDTITDLIAEYGYAIVLQTIACVADCD